MTTADGAERGLAEEEKPFRREPQPVGAELDLLGRFLARDVEDRPDAVGHLGAHLQEERRLADARIAPEKDERAGDDPAAEGTVELVP
jgi:hypothetical protein